MGDDYACLYVHDTYSHVIQVNSHKFSQTSLLEKQQVVPTSKKSLLPYHKIKLIKKKNRKYNT